MKDKERILMAIATRIIPGMMFLNKTEYLSYGLLEKGDLVIASTSRTINDFVVSFVDDVQPNCVVVREIGSKKLCNYYNESFYVINKSKLGYEFLEGTKYKIYEKVINAFSRFSSYSIKFKSIRFENKKCYVASRIAFSNDLFFEISFDYNSKTTIQTIFLQLEKAKLENEGK